MYAYKIHWWFGVVPTSTKCLYKPQRSILFKEKGDTAANIKTFFRFIENQTGETVKMLSSENGTEFYKEGKALFAALPQYIVLKDSEKTTTKTTTASPQQILLRMNPPQISRKKLHPYRQIKKKRISVTICANNERQPIEEKVAIDATYVPTADQVADVLTKPLMKEKFMTCETCLE
ncbi:unnamed protein product [Orchesella dallaii]|uniref:Transposase n=1 Tax=Orchesella dallaii TaxID=48710 RepID=A0ABP1RPE0_9HEXA